MKTTPKSEIARLRAAYDNSRAGLRDIWRSEAAFRLEAVLIVLSLPAAALLAQSIAHFGLKVGSLLLVLNVEVLNTAIEACIDRIDPERHDLSRLAKDLGSAAVLLTALFPAGIWGAIVLARLGVITL